MSTTSNMVSINLNQNKEKIKTAIKNKLIEIGAYVDDELPDYIIIMLENKKPEKQMTEDLKLFLNDHAAKFSSWLQHVLKKLNENPADFKINDLRVKSNGREKKKDLNENAEPELAIQIDSNEFNDEFAEQQKLKLNVEEIAFKVKQKRNAVIQQKQQIDEIHKTIQQPEQTKVSVAPTITNEKHEEKSTSNSKKSSSSSKSSSSKSTKTSSESSVKSSIASRVGAVIKHNDRDLVENDLKYDPLKPMIGNVSSVIKVSERKSSVPKSMQANKSILFKAVDEANNSTSQTKPSSHRNSIKKSVNENIIEEQQQKSHSEEQHINKSIKSRLDFSSTTKQPGLFDKRRVEIGVQKEEAQIETIEQQPEQEIQQPPQTSTKFYVTLKGIDERKFLGNLNVNTSNVEEELKGGLKRRLSDDYDEAEMEEECEEEDEEEEYEENMDVDDPELIRKKIRCIYWPACEKGTSCPYIHPNKPCEAFPNCQYGIKCIYLHPSCRFDGYCTRADCIYTHMIKSNQTPAQLQLLQQQQEILLKQTLTNKPVSAKVFYPTKSLYPKAKKLHVASKYAIDHTKNENKKMTEIECKFGKTCKNPYCIYNHPQLPKKSALKWSATKATETSKTSISAPQAYIKQPSTEEMKVE